MRREFLLTCRKWYEIKITSEAEENIAMGILEGRTSFDIDIHKVKLKVAQKEKRKKKHGFSFKNI